MLAGVHLRKEAIVVRGPLILITPASKFKYIDLDQLESEARYTCNSCRWQHESRLSFLSKFK